MNTHKSTSSQEAHGERHNKGYATVGGDHEARVTASMSAVVLPPDSPDSTRDNIACDHEDTIKLPCTNEATGSTGDRSRQEGTCRSITDTVCTYMRTLWHRRKNDDNDDGFMGYTHALSGVALSLGVLAFYPTFYHTVIGTSSTIALYILFILSYVGATSINDLDNSVSSAGNRLGPLGRILSIVFRGSSHLVQHATASKYDDPDDPHRGFWHTTVGCLLMGAITVGLCGMSTRVEVLRYHVTWGFILSGAICTMLVYLCLAIIGKDIFRHASHVSTIRDFVTLTIAIIVTVTCMAFIVHHDVGTMNFGWLGYAVGLGTFTHCIGDCFTKEGAPLLFPLKIRGKRWWHIRFLYLTAGGAAENAIIVPLFLVISVVSLSTFIVQHM